MPRNSAIPPESLEEILTWLNPDREIAGAMYVQLREDLQKLFIWGKCADPEGLTDEVFDRVARKVHDVQPTYEGDPRLYFRGVANNLIKENFKKVGTHVSLDDADLSTQQTKETGEENERLDECLQRCLQKLAAEKRELILGYYSREKQAKIDHRSKLAEELGITVAALRVRVYRIRASLDGCIRRCLKREAR
jgi:RNA polymerase sigma factor (sigma-70 family)